MSGRLLRLFLVDGTPDGLRTIEVSNMTLLGTIIPRPQLARYLDRDGSNRPGVYLLLGPDIEDPEQVALYVGEGDPVGPRLSQHSHRKDFWTEAIAYTSKDGYLTKTQIQYLEAALYQLAREAGRVRLDNTQVPAKPNISEVDKAEVEQFLDGIKLSLSAVGINVLEPRIVAVEDPPQQVFELRNKSAVARMVVVDNKYVVLRGSTAVVKNRQSCPTAIQKLRDDLVSAGILASQGANYAFLKDAAFSSPSYPEFDT
jgi:hypothetical protein